MKPRIQLSRYWKRYKNGEDPVFAQWHRWVCYVPDHKGFGIGFGATPKEAYDMWLDKAARMVT